MVGRVDFDELALRGLLVKAWRAHGRVAPQLLLPDWLLSDLVVVKRLLGLLRLALSRRVLSQVILLVEASLDRSDRFDHAFVLEIFDSLLVVHVVELHERARLRAAVAGFHVELRGENYSMGLAVRYWLELALD